jgi:uncharacterized membrane protein
MDIGRDNGGDDLSCADRAPFAFTGAVRKVVLDVKPDLSTEDEHALQTAGTARAHHPRTYRPERHAHLQGDVLMAFDDETTDVVIGDYLSKDAAKDDYEAVLGSGGYLHGAAVVTKDLEGNLSVEQSDHIVREGAAGLGAGGFAVGLFAPPLLAVTAIGETIGAVAGKPLHHKTANKLEKQAGATISLGGEGLIVAYPRSAAGKVQPAVTRATTKVVGEAEGHQLQALKGAIADAQQKVAENAT